MNLSTITDPKTKEKIVSLYGQQYRPASYVYFPVSGKSITPASSKRQSCFELAPRVNSVITFSGYLLQEILRTFGIYNHGNVDISTLLYEHPFAEIEKREEDTVAEIAFIFVKETANGISLAVIVETGELQESSHTEPYHVVFDDDLSQLNALTEEVQNG